MSDYLNNEQKIKHIFKSHGLLDINENFYTDVIEFNDENTGMKIRADIIPLCIIKNLIDAGAVDVKIETISFSALEEIMYTDQTIHNGDLWFWQRKNGVLEVVTTPSVAMLYAILKHNQALPNPSSKVVNCLIPHIFAATIANEPAREALFTLCISLRDKYSIVTPPSKQDSDGYYDYMHAKRLAEFKIKRNSVLASNALELGEKLQDILILLEPGLTQMVKPSMRM